MPLRSVLRTSSSTLSGDLDVVDLFHAVPRMREAVGQLAVVGHQDQAFARHVEPADAVGSRGVGRQHVDDPRPAGGIPRRADDALRLVYREVDRLGVWQDFAVDADFLFMRVDADAELGDHLAVDFDAAIEDQLFALASAGNAGGGEHFLQAVGAGSGLRRGGSARDAGF